MEMAKAIMLAAAFLFWAANQFWPSLPEATLFNDIAIALFVLDVFLVIVRLAANFAGRLFSLKAKKNGGDARSVAMSTE